MTCGPRSQAATGVFPELGHEAHQRVGGRYDLDALAAHPLGLFAEGGTDHLAPPQQGVEPAGSLVEEVAEGQVARRAQTQVVGFILDRRPVELGVGKGALQARLDVVVEFPGLDPTLLLMGSLDPMQDHVAVGDQAGGLFFQRILITLTQLGRGGGALQLLIDFVGQELRIQEAVLKLLDQRAEDRLEAAQGPLDEFEPFVEAVIDAGLDGPFADQAEDLHGRRAWH